MTPSAGLTYAVHVALCLASCTAVEQSQDAVDEERDTCTACTQEVMDAAAIAQHCAGESASVEEKVKFQLELETGSLKFNGCRRCDGMWVWNLAWCHLPQYLSR